MCNYYIVSSAVRYHVWSLAYSTLFGWCHTGTNIQCYRTRLQPLARGYSDWRFSVASYNRPAMHKIDYSSVNAGLISLLEELHYLTVTVLNPRYKLRLADDSVQNDNADHRADGRSFPSQVTVLISQFQSTDDRWQPAFSIWRPACWLSCTVTSARISQQQANLNKLSKLE